MRKHRIVTGEWRKISTNSFSFWFAEHKYIFWEYLQVKMSSSSINEVGRGFSRLFSNSFFSLNKTVKETCSKNVRKKTQENRQKFFIKDTKNNFLISWMASKLKIFCLSKDTTEKMKRRTMGWEKRVAMHMSEGRLVLRIYKEFLQIYMKRQPN